MCCFNAQEFEDKVVHAVLLLGCRTLSDRVKPWLAINNLLIGKHLPLQAITCKGLKEWRPLSYRGFPQTLFGRIGCSGVVEKVHGSKMAQR